jgi:hypothetical protein
VCINEEPGCPRAYVYKKINSATSEKGITAESLSGLWETLAGIN